MIARTADTAQLSRHSIAQSLLIRAFRATDRCEVEELTLD